MSFARDKGSQTKNRLPREGNSAESVGQLDLLGVPEATLLPSRRKAVGEVYPRKGGGEASGEVSIMGCRLGESCEHGRDTSEQFPALFDGYDTLDADTADKIEKSR